MPRCAAHGWSRHAGRCAARRLHPGHVTARAGRLGGRRNRHRLHRGRRRHEYFDTIHRFAAAGLAGHRHLDANAVHRRAFTAAPDGGLRRCDHILANRATLKDYRLRHHHDSAEHTAVGVIVMTVFAVTMYVAPRVHVDGVQVQMACHVPGCKHFKGGQRHPAQVRRAATQRNAHAQV